MAVEKLQEYIDSVNELQRAYSKVQEYGAIIGNFGEYLNRYPYKVTVSNVKASFAVTPDREYTLNANDRPTAQQLAEVLSDYISKRERTKTL